MRGATGRVSPARRAAAAPATTRRRRTSRVPRSRSGRPPGLSVRFGRRAPGSEPCGRRFENGAVKRFSASVTTSHGVQILRRDWTPNGRTVRDKPPERLSHFAGLSRSGRQDLNLRPPGPPAGAIRTHRSGFSCLERTELRWVVPGCAQFGPRIGPRLVDVRRELQGHRTHIRSSSVVSNGLFVTLPTRFETNTAVRAWE